MRQAHDLQHADELVDSWDRQVQQRIHVLPVEPRSVLDDVAKGMTMMGKPAGERALGIELNSAQRPAPHLRERNLPWARG